LFLFLDPEGVCTGEFLSINLAICFQLCTGYSVSVKNADPICDIVRTEICDIIRAETSTGFEVFMTTVALSQLLEDRERINWVYRRNLRNMGARGYEYLNGKFMHRGSLVYFCNHAGESDSSDSETN
jgi:hypothetical protein